MFATVWYPLLDIALIAGLCGLACWIVSLEKFRCTSIGQWSVVIALPILLTMFLLPLGAMVVFKDGRDFGFPIYVRGYRNATEFEGSYITLGASYLIARDSTKMLLRPVRIFGWIETIGIVLLVAFELFLMGRRLWIL